MIEKLRTLAQLRTIAESAITAKQDAEASAKATPEWEAYNNAAINARRAADEADEYEVALRAELIKNFDGVNKKPYDGVAIEETRTGKILDEAAALKWALTNFTPAVLLDKRAIERAAKDGTITQDFVTVEIGNRVKLATDLSGYLK